MNENSEFERLKPVPDFVLYGSPPTANLKKTVQTVIEPLINSVATLFTNNTKEKIIAQDKMFNDTKTKATAMGPKIDLCDNEEVTTTVNTQIEEQMKNIDECKEQSKNLILLKSRKLDEVKTLIIENTDLIPDESHDISKRESILTQFKLINTSCQRLLEEYHSSITEIDETFKQCEELCKIFVENNIPEIEKQIIICIRAKIKNKLDNAKIKIDPIKDKLTIPDKEFPTQINKGTKIIEEIKSLLAP
jgi:hypothetical protein